MLTTGNTNKPILFHRETETVLTQTRMSQKYGNQNGLSTTGSLMHTQLNVIDMEVRLGGNKIL